MFPVFAPSATQPVIPEQNDFREKLIGLANHIASAANGIPFGWQDWADEIVTDLRSLASTTQPVSEPYNLPVGYFSYGSEHGFDWHKTEKEAIESAEAAIDDYRGDACDGWSEETDSVCWGVILQQATKVDERPRTDDDKCDPSIDTVCDYALLPAQETNND